MRFADFEHLARAANLEAVDRGKGHWQVHGGKLLVNFYPDARRGPTYYVAGTTKGMRGDAAAALRAANAPPPRGPVKRDRRRSSYRRIKARMIVEQPQYWRCQRYMTLDRKRATTEIPFATLEHRIPLDRGGIDNRNNFVLACDGCNQEAGNEMSWMED